MATVAFTLRAKSFSTEAVQRDISQLNSEQLQQVAYFIAFLKFQGKYRRIELDPAQLAPLATEFAEEDKAFSEVGIDEYAVMLEKEDRCVAIIKGEGGLSQDSVALCFQTRAIDKTRLVRKLGNLSDGLVSELESVVLMTLGYEL